MGETCAGAKFLKFFHRINAPQQKEFLIRSTSQQQLMPKKVYICTCNGHSLSDVMILFEVNANK